MDRPRTTDRALLDALNSLFREHGYEGASLSLISKATGLKRASLYHRFPGGKQEMALAVLRHVHQVFSAEVLAPLAGAGTPVARVRKAAKVIDAFYGGGERGCLVDTLSLGGRTREVRAAIVATLEALTRGFAAVAREAGHSSKAAERVGQDAVVRLQGSLVLSRATGDTQAFQRFIKTLPKQITEGA